jgi:hypothetical protein
MRRIVDDQAGAWVDHVWYPDTSAAAYVAAQAVVNERRRARRVRLLALLEADGLLEEGL